jgi:hypothetical protein
MSEAPRGRVIKMCTILIMYFILVTFAESAMLNIRQFGLSSTLATCLTFILSIHYANTSIIGSVTTVNNIVSVSTTYQWTINYANSADRGNFTLYFPSCVDLTDASVILTPATANISTINSSAFVPLNHSPSYINFMINPPIHSLSYAFNVTNVNKCYYYSQFNSSLFRLIRCH